MFKSHLLFNKGSNVCEIMVYMLNTKTRNESVRHTGSTWVQRNCIVFNEDDTAFDVGSNGVQFCPTESTGAISIYILIEGRVRTLPFARRTLFSVAGICCITPWTYQHVRGRGEHGNYVTLRTLINPLRIVSIKGHNSHSTQ